MPAEWAPHERTLMAWPCRAELWDRRLDRAELDYAAVARAIAEFEPVTMLARPADAERAATACGPDVEVVEMALDDSWVRDTGPIYVTGGGQRMALDFRFNAWGEKFAPYADDAAVAERWCEHTGEKRQPVDMVLEGGAIAVDGQGTLLTTEQCLLNPNRNPSMDRAAIEPVLAETLGVDTVIWLPFGLDDRDTDGHVDTVACFAQPGTVVLQGCDHPGWRDYDRLAETRRTLAKAHDAAGRPLEIVDVPVLPLTEFDGELYAVPYLNLYLANGAAIVPVTGHPADNEMVAIIAEAFPDRRIVPVPGAVLAFGGGGPHCITQQVPSP